MIQTIDLVQPDLVDGDNDPIHLTCCSGDVALCGENLEDHEWVWDTSEDQDCVMCAYICDNDLPCPVPGCTGEGAYR